MTQIPLVSVSVKNASVNEMGRLIVTYDASHAGGSVEDRQIQFLSDGLGDESNINGEIALEAATALEVSSPYLVTVFGGATYQAA